MLNCYLGKLVDIEHYSKDEDKKQEASDLMALLTPIACLSGLQKSSICFVKNMAVMQNCRNLSSH